MQQPSIDLHLLSPVLILSGTVLAVLIVDLFLKDARKWLSMWVGVVGVVSALGAVLSLVGTSAGTLDGAYIVDGFSLLFQGFFCLVAIAVLFMSSRYLREGVFYQGEFYTLLLTAFVGCMLMPAVRDLLMLFIAIELVSAPGFLLAAFRKRDVRSTEAGFKFFIIGVLSSTIMLYGMSLIYGITGSLNLHEIAAKLAGPLGDQPLTVAAILFVVGGFGFKVSSVPFHFWAPDTYEGSPVPVAAFLSVASKTAGFTGLLILMFIGFINQAAAWAPVFAILAILTMTLGNLVALKQTQVVRLFAYSSVAQAGYMLLPFALAGGTASQNASAFASVAVYILIYSVMNLGAFAVIIVVSRERPQLLISDFAGLMKRAPFLAVAMSMFTLSLAGIPPTGGFWGKLFIFRAAADRGTSLALLLAVVMVVNSVISLGYYLKLPKQMIFVDTDRGARLRVPALVGVVVAVTGVLILVIGVIPGIIVSLPPGTTAPGF